MIAQKTRYALRSLLFLAEEAGGGPVQLSRIAETQRVPPKYLELIMLDLKKAGLVKSAWSPATNSRRYGCADRGGLVWTNALLRGRSPAGSWPPRWRRCCSWASV